MDLFGCISTLPHGQKPIDLIAVDPQTLPKLQSLTSSQKNWLSQQNFTADIGSFIVLPDDSGNISTVLFGWSLQASIWQFASIVQALPVAIYQLQSQIGQLDVAALAKVWGLCCYEFTRYRLARKKTPTLLISNLTKKNQFSLNILLNATYQIRNWINTPAEDFGPMDLSDICHALAKRHQAHIEEVVGDDLKQQNYPLIHLVGRASNRPPRMICLRWGNPKDPLIALVGKGVCFDTGGIQVKPHNAMQSMKKDMGGAAHMIALSEMIMASKLPVSIALWIAACDNSVSAASFLPGDVYKARNGMSVEIGHTDAEGRLILADLLSACSQDSPQCIIDYATLTGAQRVALGMDIPSVFSNNTSLSESLCSISQEKHDWIWPLPLYEPYKKQLDSDIADICSTGKTPYGGSIIAALFLQHFISANIDWLHIDGSAYNETARPGRDKGGEAMGLETLFSFVQQHFCA